MVTLYGIPNCDTVKKARAWLSSQGLAYNFYDFKKAGVPPERLASWEAALGWQKLLNRQGTTWHKLDAAVRAGVTDEVSAQALMRDQPSVIKRPVVDWGDSITVGFDAEAWSARAA